MEGRCPDKLCGALQTLFSQGAEKANDNALRSAALPKEAALQMQFTVATLLVKKAERTARRRGMQMLAAGLCVLCLAGSLRAVLRASAEQAYRFPLKTAAWRVSDGYGERTDPFTGQAAFHAGVDLACAEGTAVQAAQNGVVTRAKHSASYGNVLYIQQAEDHCLNRFFCCSNNS